MKIERKIELWVVSARGWVFGILYGALLYERQDFHWTVFALLAALMLYLFWSFLDGDERAMKDAPWKKEKTNDQR